MRTVSEFQNDMHTVMEKAVHQAAIRIQRDAQKMAPVRKIFKEAGAARMEERSFRVKTASGFKTQTVTVRNHRANRYSQTKLARQSFKVVAEGTPDAIEVGASDKGTRSLFVVFNPPKSLVSARGRYEIEHMATGYAASVAERRNVNPISTTSSWSRQTMVRIKDTVSIREIVKEGTAAAKAVKLRNQEIEHETALDIRDVLKKAARIPQRRTKANGFLLNRAQFLDRERARITEERAQALAENVFRPPAGGLISREGAKNMTAFQGPEGMSRFFHGAQLSEYAVRPAEGQARGHFHLQVGGHLRESITVTEEKGGARAQIGTDVPYAKYMEFGTKHNKPFTFLRPALHNHRDEFLATVKEGARGNIKG